MKDVSHNPHVCCRVTQSIVPTHADKKADDGEGRARHSEMRSDSQYETSDEATTSRDDRKHNDGHKQAAMSETRQAEHFAAEPPDRSGIYAAHRIALRTQDQERGAQRRY